MNGETKDSALPFLHFQGCLALSGAKSSIFHLTRAQSQSGPQSKKVLCISVSEYADDGQQSLSHAEQLIEAVPEPDTTELGKNTTLQTPTSVCEKGLSP